MHITELPSGWLGKVNAMRVATEATSGDWLLYTDADVLYGPGLLRKVMAMVVADKLDHVAGLARAQAFDVEHGLLRALALIDSKRARAETA